LPYGDDDKRPLGGGVRSYLTGSATQQTSPFEDALGEARADRGDAFGSGELGLRRLRGVNLQ
jgi:hypothetical protein